MCRALSFLPQGLRGTYTQCTGGLCNQREKPLITPLLCHQWPEVHLPPVRHYLVSDSLGLGKQYWPGFKSSEGCALMFLTLDRCTTTRFGYTVYLMCEYQRARTSWTTRCTDLGRSELSFIFADARASFASEYELVSSRTLSSLAPLHGPQIVFQIPLERSPHAGYPAMNITRQDERDAPIMYRMSDETRKNSR